MGHPLIPDSGSIESKEKAIDIVVSGFDDAFSLYLLSSARTLGPRVASQVLG